MVGRITGLVVALLAVLALACSAQAQEIEPPNIVFVLADDMTASDLAHMPIVRRELVAKGATFERYAVSWPTCCPSRATMLTGMYAHNHEITGKPGASGPSFASRGLDEDTLATHLDDAGYDTFYAGKYLNDYRAWRYTPPGWDYWRANSNNDVWASCLAQNGRERCYGKKNMDVVLSGMAERYVAGRTEPFFLWLSPNAPHQKNGDPPPYLKRDRAAFSDAPLPRLPSFEEADVSDKPPWIRDNPTFGGRGVKAMQREYRARLRSLQVVDRAVGSILEKLEASGELENTYVVFSSDNGYHMGEHRMKPQKAMPYIEDVRVPLVVRGPGVQAGSSRDELVLNTDLAPTFAELAGAEPPANADGRSFAPLLRGENTTWRDAILMEGVNAPRLGRPAFSGVWTADGGWYVEYASGEKEMYDLTADPHQLENLAGQGRPEEAELSARLSTLRECSGETCKAAENP